MTMLQYELAVLRKGKTACDKKLDGENQMLHGANINEKDLPVKAGPNLKTGN